MQTDWREIVDLADDAARNVRAARTRRDALMWAQFAASVRQEQLARRQLAALLRIERALQKMETGTPTGKHAEQIVRRLAELNAVGRSGVPQY